ncbi:unnamed protein product [Lathyrus oleraceus]
MASPQNVEMEAANFLHKLIQDSKDEPAKLATKLYVILQHMKSSGKENSMPFQVISRAMETVINQHGLDIEALKSLRLPLTGGPQIGSSSQAAGGANDSRAGLAENEAPKMEPFAAGRPPIAPTGGAPEYYQGTVAQRSNQSFDQGSPTSLDSRSANSQSQDRQVNQKDGKKAIPKRKRGDSTSPGEMHVDSSSLVEPRNTGVNSRKGKMTKAEPSDGIQAKSGEMTNFNVAPNNTQMENISTFSGNMKTMIRANQEGHLLLAKQTDLTKIGNPMARAPNSKYPEDVEVSSAHIAPGKQQQGAYARVHGGMAVPANVSPMNEPVISSSMQYGGPLDRDGGSSTTLSDGHKISQTGRQNSGSEMTMLRQGVHPRDTGKSPVPAAAASSTMPFKENQLKQLRAQCLVFLAFRNGLPPKKLHLDVAFGTFFSREDGSNKDLNEPKGKSQSFNEPGNTPGVIVPFGSSSNLRQTDKNPSGSSSAGKFIEAESLSKGTESPRMLEDKGNLHSDIQTPSEDRKHLAAKRDVERRNQERMAAQSSSATQYQQKDSSSTRGIVVGNSHLNDGDNGILTAGRANQHSVIGPNNWTGSNPHVSPIQHELPIERRENIPSQFQNVSNNSGSWNHNSINQLTSYSLKEHWKPVPGIDSNSHGVTVMKDGNVLGKNVSAEQGGNERLVSTDFPSSKRFTMSERCIMDRQRKRLLAGQNWVQKQQKAKERMTKCFHKLKENVSSCEDISAKTKSVIELKKLQLLELQRRLRSDFLNDFSKPITNEMEHLKSIKKHRHGRRVKQLEKYEQKMKEERQKRIRERQKEFFSEIEVHKERLDDVFKIKRERWKGFNKYVKEFHKRKERIHRERIDRIQREKINLLKINDVEGYLRMVQDAKSDRVKQLLKATEKYLQKLGSKLQEAKTAAGRLGLDVDEAGSTNFLENSETTLVDEDESDQAKHYMESNEKYYKMAHSVKESIAEQPAILHGGKLREYQMNGLRWLVSLYNNHLNGILADEMGLGKTVQVISLICYLMETKNDRGPFLVVVPSSVLPGWESEINFWAPSIHKIVYAGPPEERRRLFKERIIHQKFNVLLTTYEYLMNKHDRPKLSKVHWHYIIIDEGHRIKNASCKLNADLKHYQSSHRLLLTGTPLQNNLEELWALLNFLLPNIFNSSEDFSQWFNKPFESTGDNSPDEALLSEEENLLIINRLHQVLRPFVLRRLKHKVENQLPSKIERLIRCEASSYQKLLMKRVEDNLGAIGTLKARSVHNSVMELRNICNHPYLSQLHTEEVDNYIPKHYLPPIIRLCGKLEMLDRLLPKLKATDHRVLFFSTMTRLLDVMEEYLTSKQYRYLRLDGHTSGGDRGALIDLFNKPDSPYFIFLLSIRAGGVGVNLQAADTVILFDTDWNPQVDLQAQARAHRIGQKRDVLVLRFETVQTVEEQVRASAEHKLGVANQSITAGFFDNNTSAEDRREYLESLLRECKKEEDAPVLDDDALNDVLARSEAELDVFESVDRNRKEHELVTWKKLVLEHATDGSDVIPPLPSRLVTDEDLKQFNEAMKIYDDVPKGEVDSNGVKRKRGGLGGLDTQHYGRGKRAREVRSYEEQWTEEEFEKMCQAETSDSLIVKVEEMSHQTNASSSVVSATITQPAATVPQPAATVPQPAGTAPQTAAVPPLAPILPSVATLPVQHVKEIAPPAKRGRGRPKRTALVKSPAALISPVTSGIVQVDMQLQKGNKSGHLTSSAPDSVGHSAEVTGAGKLMQQSTTGVTANVPPATPLPNIPPNSLSTAASVSVPIQAKGHGQKTQSGRELPRRRGKKQVMMSPPAPDGSVGPDVKVNEQLKDKLASPSSGQGIPQNETVPSVVGIPQSETVPSVAVVHPPTTISGSASNSGNTNLGAGVVLNSQLPLPLPSVTTLAQTAPSYPSVQMQSKGQIGKSQTGAGTSRRRGKKQATMSSPVPVVLGLLGRDPTYNLPTSSGVVSGDKASELKNLQESNVQESKCIIQDQASQSNQDLKSLEGSDDLAKQAEILPSCKDSTVNSPGQDLEKVRNADVHNSSVMIKSSEINPSKVEVCTNSGNESLSVTSLPITEVTKDQYTDNKAHQTVVGLTTSPLVVDPLTNSSTGIATTESISQSVDPVAAKIVPSTLSTVLPSAPGSESNPSTHESVSVKRQGRKIQNRLEPPRRRGKKTTPVLPVAPDALIGQDPKLSHHAQVNSMVGTATSNITQAQAFEILLPGGVANDSKRKERTTNPAQNKQQKVASTRIDSAPVSSDKIAALGRIHNVNDVARVMKEVFSGTCLPKPKASVDASGSQSVEDKACSATETAGAACHTDSVEVHDYEKQSEVASDMKNPEENLSLDAPVAGALSPTTTMPGSGNKQQLGLAFGEKIILENTALPTVSKPETNCYGEAKEKADQTQHYIEHSTSKSEMEALNITPLNNDLKVDGSSEKPPTGRGSTELSIETPPHHIGSSVVSPVIERPLVDHNLESQSDSIEKCSRSSVDINGQGCPTIPLAPEICSNNPESSQADICIQSHSSAHKALDITENTSNEKLEHSKPSSSLACAGQAEISSDLPKVTSADHVRNNTAPLNLSLDPASPSEPSSKALEPSMKQHSESASDKEGPVSPKAVQAQKHPDTLEPVDLHGTSKIESFSESPCQERRDIGDSSSETIVTNIVGVSGIDSLGGGTTSETAVLPPSTLVKEKNRVSVPLEVSMEKAVANCSGVQEEAKIDKVESDDQMDSSTTSPDGLKESKIERGDNFEVGDDTLKSSSQNDMEGSNTDQSNCSDRLQSSHLMPDNRDLKINKMAEDCPVTVGQIDAAQVSEPGDDPKRLSSENMDVLPSCSPVKEDNVDVQDKQRDPLIPEGSSRDGTKDSIVNPLPQEKSVCSEAEMVDLGLTSKTMELPSSAMEKDKVDVLSERDILRNPLDATKREDNQMDDNKETEIGHQIEASSVEKDEGLSEKDIDGSTARMQAAVGDGIESNDNLD